LQSAVESSRATTDTEIATERFRRHRLLRPGPADAADVVGWFGAVQAQEYRAARVIGTWKVRKNPEGVEVALTRGRTQRSFHDRDLEKAIERYRTFAGIGTTR